MGGEEVWGRLDQCQGKLEVLPKAAFIISGSWSEERSDTVEIEM